MYFLSPPLFLSCYLFLSLSDDDDDDNDVIIKGSVFVHTSIYLSIYLSIFLSIHVSFPSPFISALRLRLSASPSLSSLLPSSLQMHLLELQLGPADGRLIVHEPQLSLVCRLNRGHGTLQLHRQVLLPL